MSDTKPMDSKNKAEKQRSASPDIVDLSSEQYETVCNIGTGFSEAVLEALYEQLSPIIIDKPKPFYSHSAGNKDQPDVWFESKYVWEGLSTMLNRLMSVLLTALQ